MVEKKAVEIVTSSLDPENQFFSHHLFDPKRWGSRPIFNLKQLNQWVKYEHFKIEGFFKVKSVMKMGDFMCKIDLKDAYVSDEKGNSFSTGVSLSALHPAKNYLQKS